MRTFVKTTGTILLVLSLAGCSGFNPISLLTGGGTNLGVNAQVGAENNQGVNISTGAPSISVGKEAKVETIDQSTTNNVNLEPWMLLIMLCLAAGGAIGWVDNVVRLFTKK